MITNLSMALFGIITFLNRLVTSKTQSKKITLSTKKLKASCFNYIIRNGNKLHTVTASENSEFN